LTLNIDGGTALTATIAATDYSDKNILASAIQTAVNDAINTWNAVPANSANQKEHVKVEALTVADTDRVRFQISSGKEGAGSQITFTATDGALDLGFNTVSATGQAGQDASVSFHI